METWVAVFIVVTGVAVTLQMAILAALYFQMRRTTDNVNRLMGELHERVGQTDPHARSNSAR
jgi:hypothetical protein